MAHAKPLPPGTILRAPRSLVRDGQEIIRDGEILCVGPYSQSGGFSLLWLFSEVGELNTTADRPWVDEHFEVVRLGTSNDWYHFPEPWPPALGGSAA
jgi:hypothetical protein